jgi:hypothetical protein
LTEETWTPPTTMVVPPAARQVTWTGATQYVSLYRSDRLKLIYNHMFVGRHTIDLETAFNQGFGVKLSRQTMPADSHEGSLFSFGFFSVGGDDEVESPFQMAGTYLIDTSLISFHADIGSVRRSLGGETFTAFGFRYLEMDDQYDLVFNSGILMWDYVRTENQLALLNGRIGGRWSWQRWEMEAEFSGGIGGNFAEQSGHWLADQPSNFDPVSFEFAVASELSAVVRRYVIDNLSVDIGFRGLYVGGVMTARESYGGPGEATDMRYAGCTLGIQYEY